MSLIPGKTYWNIEREWHEEFIYFLMVDRFHDNAKRTSAQDSGRSRGFGTQPELVKFYGGTIRGITSHLDYIQGLGCTALWLSPIFENDGALDAVANHCGDVWYYPGDKPYFYSDDSRQYELGRFKLNFEDFLR